MNSLLTFFKEVRSEIRKMSWPNQEEMIGSTIIVFVFVAFFAVVFGSMDWLFASSIRKIIMWSRGL